MSEEKESSEKTRTRQASYDSEKNSARTLSSESALERLQSGLEKLDKTTIELRRSPRKTNDLPEDPTAPVSFPCKKCSFVIFTTFADLIEHMMLSHDPPADLPGFRKIERKSYDCPTCKFPFPSAFKMKQHADKKECFEVADDDQLATPTLSRKDKRGFHLCQMCDFKCKDGNLMQQHLREGHYPNRDCFVSADPRLRRLGEEFRKNEIDLLNQPLPSESTAPSSVVPQSPETPPRKLRPARNLRAPQRFEGFHLSPPHRKLHKTIPLASREKNLKQEGIKMPRNQR
ncbi:Oidioi.mRNA.OKI2018_I69.PAR.g10011.t1.cds [Oikopleura dioica]|uniref:Oidioi.mRNA.OKI2018_I69.PAR.g10011.t1.cds n=1 Tax=Oikopleura dioica TaxID=34765 RepID=A0ABN7RSI5_OIKDI|nr:Oidioi.mRNA.OKI2018_I69.PAR.g10011.t1.cds [Oikopleura dioica]